MIVPVMFGWTSQTKLYTAGVENVHVPDHGGGAAGFGSGGTGPVDVPSVCWHAVGCAPENLTLCLDMPLG